MTARKISWGVVTGAIGHNYGAINEILSPPLLGKNRTQTGLDLRLIKPYMFCQDYGARDEF